MPFPFWSALIVQVPPPTIVTVVLETVQVEVVADVNTTGVSPDDALAEIAKLALPKVLFTSEPKFIVWAFLLIVKL